MNIETINTLNKEELSKLQPKDWSDISIDFKIYTENDFCYPIKVTLNNETAGVGSAILFRDTCWIAHIIVDENHRRKGIGNAIVDHLIKYAINNGIKTCVLSATEMGAPVYERLGFRIISPYTYLNKETATNSYNPSAKVTPFNNSYLQQILKLDKLATGENREALLIPRLKDAHIYTENGKAHGYYLPGLGEGVLIANSTESAFELMKLRYKNVERTVLPSENKAGIDLLKNIGFKEIPSRGVRMVYGPDVNWKPEMIYSRLGPNFG